MIRTVLGDIDPGDVGQVGGAALRAFLVEELDPDAVEAEVPVQEVGGVLEVAEDGDGDVHPGQLLPGHRVEPGVLHRAGDEMVEIEMKLVFLLFMRYIDVDVLR